MNRSKLVTVAALGLVTIACTSTPASSPSNAPTSSPPPSAIALPASDLAVGPGRYYKDVAGYRYTFTVSEPGWASGGDALLSGDHDNNDFGSLFLWGDSPGVWTEPCQWPGTFVKSGPTAADLATALAALSGFETSEPTDVTVGNNHGKRLQLTVPAEVNFDSCEDGQYRSFEGRWYQVPGQVDDIRVVDVDGYRTMIRTTYDPETPVAIRTALEKVVDSMEVEPVGR